MWMLNFLPDWIFHLIVLAGIVGLLAATLLLKWIPIVSQYKLPVQLGSIAALVIGIWFEGGISNEHKWLDRVAELEAKVKESEEKSKQANEALDQKTNERSQAVKQRGASVIAYIDREVVKYDSQCVIPKEFIKAHNDAAEGVK